LRQPPAAGFAAGRFVTQRPPNFTMSQSDSPLEKILEKTIFASRWLQAPLYVGLIIAQGVYVYQFFHELWVLLHTVIMNPEGVKELGTFTMLAVLGLIDVVMIANLLVMVIIGGYETFVSRLHLDDHADQPEWLSHVNAGALKVKLATALISISSIHLLKTFIEVRTPSAVFTNDGVMWQVVIHVIFVFSAIALAWTDRLMMAGVKAQSASH
jgi:uncharacterized protein (TIGR00645 family)